MKRIIKKIIVYILIFEARLVLRKYKPKIVAVTGNIGKTSSKDAIYTVLSSIFFTRKSEKSFNSEIGIPLTILGLPNGWNNTFLWLKNIFNGIIIFLIRIHYPKWLILEVGADKPGDIESVSKWLKTDIVVMTRLPDIPVHIEFFDSAEEVIKEKSYIIKSLKKNGIFVVNGDDEKATALKNSIDCKKIFLYGFTKDLNVFASDEQIIYKDNKPVGISFRVNHGGNSILVELRNVVGIQHIYSTLSAFAVGISQGLSIVSIGESFTAHESAPGRMRLIEGINNSTIIDDSYNSSPTATQEALNTLKKISVSGRKIAVLGDMMELGDYSHDEHINIGKLTAEMADILITIGIRAKYIARSANEAKMRKRDIFEFNDAKKAGEKLAKILREGDIALVKGSQSIRTERAIEKIMAHPDKKYRLLARQEKEWQNR